MKQLQINKDSLTLEESETLAEGISSLWAIVGSTGPRETTFKLRDKDKSPWGNGQCRKRTCACQGGRIKLTQRHGDGLSWELLKGNSSPSSGSRVSLGKEC